MTPNHATTRASVASVRTGLWALDRFGLSVRSVRSNAASPHTWNSYLSGHSFTPTVATSSGNAPARVEKSGRWIKQPTCLKRLACQWRNAGQMLGDGRDNAQGYRLVKARPNDPRYDATARPKEQTTPSASINPRRVCCLCSG